MNWLYDIVVLPLSFPFMQRALIVAVIIAVCCAVMSCYLVLRGWSLMGDAVSHAVLPGIVLAAAAGIPLAVGAFAAALACAIGAGWLNANSRVKSDTVLGIVFSGMFALGLVLFTMIDSDQHLLHILFGNVLGVQTSDIAEVFVFGGLCLAFMVIRRRDLLLVSFDPAHARAIGLPTAILHYGMLIALAITIVVSIKAVGVILVVAMLIAPGAIGFLMTKRFDTMLLIAAGSAVIAALAGTIASFHLDAATGACIVLVQAGLFLAALVFAPQRGLLAQRLLRRVTV